MGSKQVIVRLRGGLGNQLFQYAAGYAISKRFESKLVIDSRQLPAQHELINGISHWPEQISEFRNASNSSFRGGTRSIVLPRLLQLERMFGSWFPSITLRLGSLAGENVKSSSLRELRPRKTVWINAYCDSPKFFEGFESELRQQITSLMKPSDSFSRDLKLVKNSRPLALHVRLGDYRNLVHIYGGIDVDYFESATALVRKLAGPRDVWIFSDEPELALSLVKPVVPNAVIAPIAQSNSGLETLILMSECGGLVASNSSFSWWAAFLMTSRNEPIIFPRPFFSSAEMQEPRDLLLKDWIQIGKGQSSV
jgi:hypothetical protein